MGELLFESVSRSYYRRGQKLKALDNVSFQISTGKIVALLGPNGAGKTTIAKIILNLTCPDSGIVTFKNELGINRRFIAHAVGDGGRSLCANMSAIENAEYFCALRKLNFKIELDNFLKYLFSFGLHNDGTELIKKLSRGSQQKVALAISLLGKPDILVLDEPTLGLDLASTVELQDQIKNLAKQKNCAVIVMTHQLDFAESTADTVMLIENGKIIHRDLKKNAMKDFAEKIRIKLIYDIDSFTLEKLKNYDVLFLSKSEFFISNKPGVIYSIVDSIRPSDIESISVYEPNLYDFFAIFSNKKPCL